MFWVLFPLRDVVLADLIWNLNIFFPQKSVLEDPRVEIDETVSLNVYSSKLTFSYPSKDTKFWTTLGPIICVIKQGSVTVITNLVVAFYVGNSVT